MNKEQMQKIAAGRGFIAALNQSGGSTPKALRMYMPDIDIEHLLKIVLSAQNCRSRSGRVPRCDCSDQLLFASMRGCTTPEVPCSRCSRALAASSGMNICR